jgi:hypothetical protein
MLISAAAPALTASATDLAGNSAVCTVTMTLMFTPSLAPAPGAVGFSVTGGGTCIGPGGGTLSLSASGTALEGLAADCGVVALTGSGMLTLPFEQPSVVLDIAGPTLAQSWTLLQSNSTQVIATGTMAWDSPSEIEACAKGGTTAMTVTGVLAVAA